MAQYYTRTLTFRSNDLGKDSTLVLTFDDSKIPGIYKDVFPTAFKVTTFGATGPYEFTVVYISDLGFTRAQISDGVVVPASTYTHIVAGEQTILTKRGSPAIYSFSKPESISPPTGQLVAANDTDTKENIGFGFFERLDRAPTQMLVFEKVGSRAKVQAEFTPILEGYIVADSHEIHKNLLLKRHISSTPLFKENLVNLEPVTNWKLNYNPGSGAYTITPDDTQVRTGGPV